MADKWMVNRTVVIPERCWKFQRVRKPKVDGKISNQPLTFYAHFKDVRGYWVKPSLKTTDEREAHKRAEKMYWDQLTDHKAGLDPKRPPLEILIEEYREAEETRLKMRQGGGRQLGDYKKRLEFINSALNKLKRHLIEGQRITRVELIKRRDIDRYMTDRFAEIETTTNGKFSGVRSIKDELAILKALIVWTANQGYISKDNVPSFPKLEVKHTPRPPFYQEDWDKLIAYKAEWLRRAHPRGATTEYYWTLVWYWLAIRCQTGWRETETRGLKWADISIFDRETGEKVADPLALLAGPEIPYEKYSTLVYVWGKGHEGQAETRPIALKYLQELYQWTPHKEARDDIFAFDDGREMGKFRTSVINLMERAGIRFSPRGEMRTANSARHFYAETRRDVDGWIAEWLAPNMRTRFEEIERTYYKSSEEVRMKQRWEWERQGKLRHAKT